MLTDRFKYWNIPDAEGSRAKQYFIFFLQNYNKETRSNKL